MEQYFIILFRTLLLYLLILLIFRLMGKREIGELSILDLVVYIMIAEMASLAIENTKDPLINTLLPISILVIIQITLALLSLKSKKFRDIVDGKPTIIINNGKIDEKAMRSQRYNFDDLLLQLREKDVGDISDVEYAILEPSGTLSIFQKNYDDQQDNSSLALPLIIDGEVQEDNLDMIDKSRSWMLEKLRNKGYEDPGEISFCSYQNGKFYIDLKDK
ncbi:DUF421 domain-containing protein [Mesobacillus sp. AQ2]|uniref:DUF421 domain-containing protein n=1 Tax=Bacillaceae TaxID=186817 RepID=UPI0011A79B3F|nr:MULTISPECIES: DUF421 domain-containing protein [Bacillaceae]MCM3122546.1 DUF421 domain-containing protein [Mesobacillus sp. MER 33]MCM3232510.1 DUF421 domain-containing protein [Mesobacillus sp. MER 48]WHX39445.1 DUF421 domain-containing protein [Mesobacillus sp. AQ2]